jgi:hypothetical protein
VNCDPIRSFVPVGLFNLPGGQVVLAVSTITPTLPHLQSGRLRPLGVSSAVRSFALPVVPTIAEQGLPGFEKKPWTCFVTTAGVPPAVLERLRSAYRTTIEEAKLAMLCRVGPAPVVRSRRLPRSLCRLCRTISKAAVGPLKHPL